MALPLPSALATARHIEDINSIMYPQGIKSPKLELNVNIQKGKFRYTFHIYAIARFFINAFLPQLRSRFLTPVHECLQGEAR